MDKSNMIMADQFPGEPSSIAVNVPITCDLLQQMKDQTHGEFKDTDEFTIKYDRYDPITINLSVVLVKVQYRWVDGVLQIGGYEIKTDTPFRFVFDISGVPTGSVYVLGGIMNCVLI